MKLLIVDDSLVIRNKINRGLLTRFEKISRAENGHQALKLAQAEQPDLITMDLTMPHMGGVECIQSLVKMLPQAYILVISALSDKATAIDALTYGANGFLCKPFTEDELCSAIERVLAVGRR
ncbi:response regulator [Arenicella xantha]|uniref:Two-component system chemotaxis response regulator CheY n=1 Tax=Arenicella xantha TaxID=644221 RepID=A0A395JMP9_9GAMM|nr:response regulator [Arenicella xantha]RBP51705.1 two-component system chemotaxis response regulator CheY [Arenicella xantha]